MLRRAVSLHQSPYCDGNLILYRYIGTYHVVIITSPELTLSLALVRLTLWDHLHKLLYGLHEGTIRVLKLCFLELNKQRQY